MRKGQESVYDKWNIPVVVMVSKFVMTNVEFVGCCKMLFKELISFVCVKLYVDVECYFCFNLHLVFLINTQITRT